MRITFVVDMQPLRVGGRGKGIVAQTKKLLFLAEALIQCNLIYLRRHPDTPSLYDSGVRYVSETGSEDWKDIHYCIKDGFGDCEDLACWRVAELRRQGIKAKAGLRHRYIPREEITLYHVLARWPNGRLEDPSKKLGMKGSY